MPRREKTKRASQCSFLLQCEGNRQIKAFTFRQVEEAFVLAQCPRSCGLGCNGSAWMTKDTFNNWLLNFPHHHLAIEVLFLDNFSSNMQIALLQATKVAYFPPRTTSKTQPIDCALCEVSVPHLPPQTVALTSSKRGTL